MVCRGCHRLTGDWLLCTRCRRRLRPAPDRLVGPGVRLVAAFEHAGPARGLVHDLKYRGLTGYADLVAQVLAPRLPRLPLVPVPRSLSRHLRYGADPARLIAARIGRLLDVPVHHLIRASVHTRRRAGGDHRAPVAWRGVKIPPGGPMIVVDDVVTTGRTIASAIELVGHDRVALAVAANAVPSVSSLREARPRPTQ